MIRFLQFLMVAAIILVGAPYGYKIARDAMEPVVETVAPVVAPVAEALEPIAELINPEPVAIIPPGTLTQVDGRNLRPRFARRNSDYAPPPFGIDAHETPAGVIWHARMPEDVTNPPLVVLLHESNRSGRAMIDMWRRVSASEGVLIVAPDAQDTRLWSADEDTAYMETLLAHVAETYGYDPARVYLYGHKRGGDHALRLVANDPGPWAAIAVHAGRLQRAPKMDMRADAATLRLQVGADDNSASPTSALSTAEVFTASGHDVDVLVIPDHDGWFYDLGPRLASDAWAFFTNQSPQ